MLVFKNISRKFFELEGYKTKCRYVNFVNIQNDILQNMK